MAKRKKASSKKTLVKKSSKKSSRRRLSKEETKQKMSSQGAGGNWFNLPEGVEVWAPEKKGRYNLDIVPYEVSTENHPEEGIEKGVLWFRTQFRVHHAVGMSEQSVVCPRSIGKKCCICDEADRLRKLDEDEDVVRQLRGQRFTAMNILHPDDPDTIAVLVLSSGKFDNILKEELQEEENEEHLDFYQCEDGGRTIRVRFSEKTFAGNKYLQATDIQFKERDDMDEDEILERVVDLDTILNVLPPEKIEALFLEGGEGETDEDEDEEQEEKEKPKSKSKSKRKSKKEEEPEEEDFDEEDDEDEDDEDEDDEEDEIPEGMIECVACEGSGKSSKGKKCVPCKGKGYLPDDEDEEEDFDDEDEDEDEDEEDDIDENEEEEDDFDDEDEEEDFDDEDEE